MNSLEKWKIVMIRSNFNLQFETQEHVGYLLFVYEWISLYYLGLPADRQFQPLLRVTFSLDTQSLSCLLSRTSESFSFCFLSFSLRIFIQNVQGNLKKFTHHFIKLAKKYPMWISQLTSSCCFQNARVAAGAQPFLCHIFLPDVHCLAWCSGARSRGCDHHF